jgi:hypothetical protein
MSATPEQMIGKTVASVQMHDMAGRDTFKDTVTWTLVEITFTDGTQVSFADSDGEVYDAFEYKGFDDDGDPIPLVEESIHIDLSDSKGVVCNGCGITVHNIPDADGLVYCPICETRTPVPKTEMTCAHCGLILKRGKGLLLDESGDWWCRSNPSNGGDAAPHEAN